MRVLSIEIGSDLTHVIEVDYKTKNSKVYKVCSFQTPLGVIGESGVRKNEEFRNALQTKLAAHGIQTKKAIFVVNSGKIANREVEIPLVKEKMIKDLLNANASEYFPVDLAQYQLVFRSISDPVLEADKRKRIFVYAVPNDLVSSYEELSAFCSLELVGLDYVGNSVYHAMHKSAKEDLACTVKIDDTATMITIINGGEVELQRTIYYGYGSLVELVTESQVFESKGYANAREVLRKERCLSLGAEDETTELGALRVEATELLSDLISNVGRVVDYYISRNIGLEFNNIVLIGNGAVIKGLDKLMSQELNIPCVVLKPITEYFASYGASFAPLEFSFGSKQTEMIVKQKKKREMFATKIFALVCLLISIIMCSVVGIQHAILKAENKSLTQEKKDLAYIEKIHDDYMATRERFKDVSDMHGTMQTINDEIFQSIVIMEAVLPSGFTYTDMTSNNESLTINGTANSLEEIETAIRNLRETELFYSVDNPSYEKDVREDGSYYYRVKLVCRYTAEINSPEQSDDAIEQDIQDLQDGKQYKYVDIDLDFADEFEEKEEDEK